MSINFDDLKKPIPYKWKPNNKRGNKFMCVAYIDSRDAQDLLDEVVGAENWQDKYELINGNLFCSVGINVGTIEDPRWVWKTDVGVESAIDPEKGRSSDSYKRACVKWGIGRFLYDLEIQSVDIGKYNNKEYPANPDTKEIFWSNDDLTKYITTRLAKKNNKVTNISMNVRSGKETPKSEKYDETKNKPNGEQTSYDKAGVYSESTINAVKTLERDGKKGKDVLADYLAGYNKANNKSFKAISQMTDVEVNELITYINDTPPSDL